MNLLGCLDTPSSGIYELNGTNVSDLDDNELAEIRNLEIGFVFQTFNLLPRANALRNVELPLIYSGTNLDDRHEIARSALASVGLAGRMTVCPCSLAISEQGAHSQRAMVSILCRFTGLLWLEELIAIAEAAGSSPVYALLKREDEKQVTEQAFANPTFVEDVARRVANALTVHPKVTWFRVEVESFESIHNHSAFADIESRPPRRPAP